MNIVALTCPNCGANIDIKPGDKISFCQYCGSKLAIDDGSTHHYEYYIDESEIRRTELEEKIAQHHYNLLSNEQKFEFICIGGIILIMLIAFFK